MFVTRKTGRLVVVYALATIISHIIPNSRAAAQTASGIEARTLTLGVVSPVNQKEIELHFRDFVRYIAKKLAVSPAIAGSVVVAPTQSGLAQLLAEGKVDFYFESPYPTYLINNVYGADATLADVLLEPIMVKRGFFVLRGKKTPFMNAPIAVKRSYLASQRPALKKFVKAFADATRYLVDNRDGTMRPLTQLLNSNDPQIVDFAYQYLHSNAEPTLYPPDEAVSNLIKMSAYMDKKLGSISANRIIDLSLLDELGTKRNQRIQK
jgi:hypothetical protein